MKKTAEDFAKEQKQISISEFFEKNKHLLGFDNPTKALLMAVKEAVDNSIDASEEAGILPDVTVKVRSIGTDKYRVTVEDNGPGIVKEQVPKIFGKLLYGSKFHRLRQNRGQQGIGISAVLLYSQLTTGCPTRVWSKPGKNKKLYYSELFLNTEKNEPEIVKDEFQNDGKFNDHGTRVEMDIVGRYRKIQGIDDYLKQTSIANPFVKIKFHGPDGTKLIFPRSVDSLPKPPKEMKLHPYGVEFGILQRLLGRTKAKTLQAFLTNEFSSVGNRSSKEICKVAKLKPDTKPKTMTRDEIDKLLSAMQKVKVQRPPLDCLSPIGLKELEKSLKREYPDAEHICAITRDPAVYSGHPFQIEVGIVYGIGKQDRQTGIFRFANRVPLLYQAGACAITEAVREVDWKRYGMQQPGNNLPVGPAIIIIHMSSVWVPFVSESKEAIAPYPEIVKEMKLAIQDAGRKLSSYLSGKRRAGEQKRRLQIFERYASEVADALEVLTKEKRKDIEKKLINLIEERIKIREEETKEERETNINNKEDNVNEGKKEEAVPATIEKEENKSEVKNKKEK